ncbi:MAG: hypothetical protein KY459_01535 [Acidobacteria bacterium]|nr:hypothetical protein [Acidobacteriota bacterium]
MAIVDSGRITITEWSGTASATTPSATLWGRVKNRSDENIARVHLEATLHHCPDAAPVQHIGRRSPEMICETVDRDSFEILDVPDGESRDFEEMVLFTAIPSEHGYRLDVKITSVELE